MDQAAGVNPWSLRAARRRQAQAPPRWLDPSWILITLGTHHLRWDAKNGTLSNQFVPLIYQWCKQHESLGACQMLLDALQIVTMKYFEVELDPGATMYHRCDDEPQRWLSDGV